MPALDDEGFASERARLEAIAYGAGSTPAEAARARIALADLVGGRAMRVTGPEARAASDTPPRADETAGPTARVEADHVGGTAGGPVAPWQTTRPRHGGPASDEPATGAGSATAAAAPDAVPAEVVAAGASAEDEAGSTAPPRGDASLPAGAAPSADPGDPLRRAVRWLSDVRRTRRAWLVGGTVVAVAVAFASGIVVGTVRPATPAASAPAPTDGAITIGQLLDAPQTYADQLPGALDVPVVLHSTRLVFTNRSLAGDDANTPWSVWAGVGRDHAQLCLVASADRIQATVGCYPKDAVLAGNVSLTASSSGGVLVVKVIGGVVQGSVSSDF